MAAQASHLRVEYLAQAIEKQKKLLGIQKPF